MPNYRSEKITYVGDVQQYPLRNYGDFRLPTITTENNRNSLVYNCLKEFNKMPKNVHVIEKREVILQLLICFGAKHPINLQLS